MGPRSERHKMIRRFVHRVTHLHMGSEFDIYLSRLQNTSVAGRPTIDEARRDYQAVVRWKAWTR